MPWLTLKPCRTTNRTLRPMPQPKQMTLVRLMLVVAGTHAGRRGRTTMRATALRTIRFLSIAAALVAPSPALGQTAGQSEPPKTEERSTGLPPRISWTFNFDAGWGTFGFANSLFDNPREGVAENLSDQWFEGYVKPALSANHKFASSSEIYGKVSVVGERTYGEAPELYGPDVSSFGPEDAYIGWKSGQSIGSSENMVDLSVGREQFRLGHGFLLWDGAAEGGSRGGYWTNARKAFAFATIARVRPGPHTVEFFYLDKDELEESDSDTKLWGLNYEITLGEHSTIGATYMKFDANSDVRPGRDGLNVFNLRIVRGARQIPARPLVRVRVRLGAKRRRARLERVDAAGRLSGRLGLVEAEALVSLCLLPGRRSGDAGQRGVRSAAARVLRLGQLVAR